MRFRTFLFFILLIPVLFSSARSLQASEDLFVVDHVVDGSTLILSDGRTIKLLGVTAPPLNDSALSKELAHGKGADFDTVQLYAHISKNHLRDLVEGQYVIVSLDPAHMKPLPKETTSVYQAYVWFRLRFKANKDFRGVQKFFGVLGEDRLLNAEMIKSGYVFADNNFESMFHDRFKNFEEDAKKRKKGVWQSKPISYEELLERAQGALSASNESFLTPEARNISLESAKRTFAQLIAMNPDDYRAYYERSWAGIGPFQNKIMPQNLEDIEDAIRLAPGLSRCYAQKHFLFRLVGRHAEAEEAYKRAIDFLEETKENPVSEFTHQAKLQKKLPEVRKDIDNVEGLPEDAYRAAMNEQHFLFFMARYKDFEPNPDPSIQLLYQKLMKDKRFLGFYQRRKEFLEQASSRDILYKTKWFENAWFDPEGVLKDMEKIDAKNPSSN